MHRGIYIVLVGVVLVVQTGCDGMKDRIESLVYEDVDRSITPVDLREEDAGRSEEAEPNDRLDRATELPILRDLQPTFGSIEPEGDVDWYRISHEADADEVVELTVRSLNDSLDLVLHLAADATELMAPLLYDLGGAGEEESVPMIRVPARYGQHFSVSAVGDGVGEYRIELRRRLSAGAVAVEPNDYPEVAAALAVPGEVQGFYDRPGDRDVFFVDGERLDDEVYRLEVASIPGVIQTLSLYAGASLETALLQVRVPEDRPAIIPNISLHGGGEGLYFVLSANETFNRERGYRLRMIEHPPAQGVTVEREPNDTEEGAQMMKPGERLRGYLHTVGDRDRFQFEIEASEEPVLEDREKAETAGVGNLGEDGLNRDISVPEIIDQFAPVPEKERPRHVIQVRTEPLGEAHRLVKRWLPHEDTGEEELEIEAGEGEEGLTLCNFVLGPGRYDIELRTAETQEGYRPGNFDYEIQLLNIARQPGLEVEPNDAREQADRLSLGEKRIGYISVDGDVDYHVFVVGPEVIDAESIPEESIGEPGSVGSDAAEEASGRELENEEADLDDGLPIAGVIAGGWEAPEMESVQLHLKGNRLNLRMELLDDEGGPVANINQGGPGADEELVVDLPHGLYYLAVGAREGSLCEPYELEVTRR